MYGLFFMLGSYFYLVYYRVEWLAFFSIFDTLQAFRYIFRCSIPKNPRAAHVFIFSFSRNHRDFKINILKFYLQIPTSFYFKECKKNSKIKYFLCPQKGHTCFCPGQGKKTIFFEFLFIWDTNIRPIGLKMGLFFSGAVLLWGTVIRDHLPVTHLSLALTSESSDLNGHWR